MPEWSAADREWMSRALMLAERGVYTTEPNPRVGCVLVRDRRMLCTGYNGAPAGLPHCDEVGHLMVDGHCVRTLHAEQNAIIQAALHGVSTQGATAYVTHQPCLTCAKMLINAGVRRVVYAGNYPDENSRRFFAEAGVELVHAPRARAADSVFSPTQNPDTSEADVT